MAVCCCSLAGTAACQHCSNNPFATDVWTNRTVTVYHNEARPFGDGLDVCPVCGKPSIIGRAVTNADRIRSMSDIDLARVIREQKCENCDWAGACNMTEWCEDQILKWLKEEK